MIHSQLWLRAWSAAMLLWGSGAAALAEDPPQAILPSYVVTKAPVQVKRDITQQDYGEAEMLLTSGWVLKQGKYWHFDMTLPDSMGDLDPDKVWEMIKPPLVAQAFTVIYDVRGQARVLRYQKSGKDIWLSIFVFGATDIRCDLVEVGPPPAEEKLTLTKPAAKLETVNPEGGNFPYLTPMPGSTPAGSHHEDGPVIIDVDVDKDNVEQQFAADGSIVKSYHLPANLASTLLFATVYKDALTQAGWKVVRVVQGPHVSDAVVNAHYTADGRDLWATMHSSGDEYNIRIADGGVRDLSKELDKDCHVALYGIHYDFNKATIRPDSEPTLNQVLALLQGKPDLALEVQGHTDNVGDDAYNQKLSEARAQSVVKWLTTKGIAASRLSSQGYGMKVPVADNGTDEGRAKNRRVELRKQNCSK